MNLTDEEKCRRCEAPYQHDVSWPKVYNGRLCKGCRDIFSYITHPLWELSKVRQNDEFYEKFDILRQRIFEAFIEFKESKNEKEAKKAKILV